MQPLLSGAVLLASLAALGCGSGRASPLFVGEDNGPDGGPDGASGDEGGGSGGDSGALRITSDGSAALAVGIELVGCQGGCASVKVAVSGGNPPYALQWSDGAQGPTRMLCGADAGTYEVTATDTAVTGGELPHAQETATASLSNAALGCSADAGAQSSMVYWVKWGGGDAGATGNAQGTISAPDGDIAVTYDGQLTALQTSAGGLLAGNDWTPASTYTSATVADAPPDPGILELTGGTDAGCTIAFSRPVTNPVLAIFSLGDFSLDVTASYEFAEPLVILSTGPGIYGIAGSFTASGETLTGHEGNGVIQLTGTFSSIAFQNPVSEYYSGITVGVRE